MSENKKRTAGSLPEDDLGLRLDELADAGRRSRKDKNEKAASGSAGEIFNNLLNRIKNGFRSLDDTLGSVRFRKGGAAAALTALFLVLVILVNIVAVKLTDRFAFLSPDLSANRIYTLSDVTVDLLNSLDEHVEIDIIATESMCKYSDVTIDPYGQLPQATELIERYAKYSSNIKIFYIDITQNPGFLDLVPDYRESIYDYSIVVRSERRTRVTSFFEMLPSLSATAYTDSTSIDATSSLTEMYISSLIKTVTMDTVPAVAYLDVLGGGDYIDNLLDALELNGYDIFTSSDFSFGYEPIPAEADMVIIGAPEYDITPGQMEQLADFLRNGGSYGKTLLVFGSPYAQELPNLSALLKEWGMELQRATVHEGDASKVLPMQSSDLFNATYMSSSYVSDALSTKDTVVYGAMNIDIPYQTVGDISVNGILCTSEKGLVSDFSQTFDPDSYSAADGAIRYIMAQATKNAAAADGTPLRSDVIIAPISLCSDNYFGSSLIYGNFSLLMSVCNQRCGVVDLNLDIAPKTLSAVDFSVDNNSIVVLTVLFSYAVPLTVALIGVIVYVRRRRL